MTDAAGLSGLAVNRKPVLGLFNAGNMALEWTGPAASLGKGKAPVPCTERSAARRTSRAWSAMTQKALEPAA